MEQVSSFDLFEDRAASLMKRWRVFHDKNRDMPNIGQTCIAGYLQEVSDGTFDNMED